MRLELALPASLILAACAGQEPCPDNQCRDWCERNVALEDVLADPADVMSSPVLSGLEYRLLEQRLFAYRRGPVLRGEDGYGVCEGTESCERFVGQRVFESLPPGDYLLWAAFDVPEDGTWTAVYERTCRTPDPNDLSSTIAYGDPVKRTIELEYTPGGKGTEVVLERFSSPAEHPETVSCATTLQPNGAGSPLHSADYLLLGGSSGRQGGEVDR